MVLLRADRNLVIKSIEMNETLLTFISPIKWTHTKKWVTQQTKMVVTFNIALNYLNFMSAATTSPSTYLSHWHQTHSTKWLWSGYCLKSIWSKMKRFFFSSNNCNYLLQQRIIHSHQMSRLLKIYRKEKETNYRHVSLMKLQSILIVYWEVTCHVAWQTS